MTQAKFANAKKSQAPFPLYPLGLLLGVLLLVANSVGCNSNASTPTDPSVSGSSPSPAAEKKIGVLLVSHGSRSENWRNMLLEIEASVKEDVLKGGDVVGIRSAFMEYHGPSIADQLKAFDEEEYTDVILVPLLLTVSSHSFDDIPVITGQKYDKQTIDNLKLEKIEIYKPEANITMAPLLDFPTVLEENVIRRIEEMSSDASKEGAVLVGYGSEPYDEEWCDMLDSIIEATCEKTAITQIEYCWCGHIVESSKEPTINAIKKVLANHDTALVLPLLVAVDEDFQGEIIGGAIEELKETLESEGSPGNIRYLGDSILPDSNINRWVIDISHELAAGLKE